MSSRVSIDFPRDGFAQLAELGLTTEAKDALENTSLPVQQHGVRQASVVVDRFHAAAANQNGKRRTELGDERAHFGFADIVRNCRDVEVIAAELAVQRCHMWKLGAARLAPGRPEVHERDLATVVVESCDLPGDIGKCKRGSEQVAST